jgi:hypothetical protein
MDVNPQCPDKRIKDLIFTLPIIMNIQLHKCKELKYQKKH